ncbi:MAG: cytochrome c oxidase subunit II [Candidatus Hydrothermarchaeota archaeon]|jgi:cytochrome c oxidase subunit 2|nr:cytochrome c oxidase subunit II [Candidatus Hydrothermarchaeota archaeon]
MVVTTSQGPLESLFDLYLYAAVVINIVVIGALLYALFRFKHAPGAKDPADAPRVGVIPSVRGTAKIGWILTAVLFLLFIPISVGTKDTVNFIEKPPAEDVLIVKVEGLQFAWSFTYPNGHKTVNELVVPANKVIVLEATARDVFHNFYVPDFKLMTDAIPGQTNVVWFKAVQPGSYQAHCNEICGVSHTFMKAIVTVKDPNDFEKWYAEYAGGT